MYIQMLFRQMKIEDQLKTNNLPPARKLSLSILVTANLIDENVAAALKPFDISIQQFNVLRILRGQKGKPANLSTIQERMVSKMSNTTRLVDKLIAKELTQRIICEANRRKVEISITEKGLNLLKEIDPKVDAVEQELIKEISEDEIEFVTNCLNKIRK
ncbi:DNA-binding transcriptional regulator, MarR family [Salegentibacter salegens]|uniref:DNA-binding transcriptional regulator, MarR family n=2 Tax=Salegentibacter salegens TaxID=143223 RepID=A0A1M7NV99_9FLAO|nr:DNA-binding MarR family transcriptional regulator [Salegentibacter salegens]SHN08076.1 DNA-binding transcriptional regulator, MarR family [Salegentibacter salegens]